MILLPKRGEIGLSFYCLPNYEITVEKVNY